MLRSLIVALLAIAVLCVPQVALAEDVFQNRNVDCSGRASQSAICQSKVDADTNPIAGSNGVLARITDIVTIIAGMAALILVIVGGIRFVTSGGDPGNVKSARNTVLYALIGLAVILVSRALILFVIGRFGTS